MDDTKISELPAATSIASPDVVPIVQDGVTKQSDVSLWKSFLNFVGLDFTGSNTVDLALNSLVLNVNGTAAEDGDIRAASTFVLKARKVSDSGDNNILTAQAATDTANLTLGNGGTGQLRLDIDAELTAGNDLTGGQVVITSQNSDVNLVAGSAVGVFSTLNLFPTNSPRTPPLEGDIYANATDHHLYFYNGTTYKQLDN